MFHLDYSRRNGATEPELIEAITGAVGNLLFNELGIHPADTVPAADESFGYKSYSIEQIGEILGAADVLIHFLNADGSAHPGIKAVMDTPFFQALPAAAAGHVFDMTTTPTDYRTGVDYLSELEQVVLIRLSK